MKKRIFTQRKTKKPYWQILVFLSVLLSMQTVMANTTLQDDSKSVSGIVTDGASGDPLPGVSIIIQGTSTGTITDIDGKYSLDVSSADILVFSYIGFLDEEVEVGDQTEINMLLVLDVMGLDEVVVIGYGVQKKKLVTGATTQVKSEDFVKNNTNRLESSLQGLTPGMVIVKQSGQPGSEYNITIRGLGSVNGSKPLVLIDGVPGDLNTLNPSDVESVDVLKDAASAAIYGSRASDGVILITTKKGKAGESTLTYDFSYGISNIPKKVEVLNAHEYATILNEGQYNVDPTSDPFFAEEYINSLGEGTNWLNEVLNENAPSQNHYLGFSGGNEVSKFSMSLSYNKEEGIINYANKSQYERMGFRLNSEHKATKYLTIGQNLTFTHREKRGLGVGNVDDNGNFMRLILSASPLIDVYDDTEVDGFGKSDYIEEQINPIALLHHRYNEINRYDDLIGNVYAELELIEGLKIRTDFGAKVHWVNDSEVIDTFTITSQNKNAVPDINTYMERKFGYNWDNIISYERSIGDHNLLVMAGMNSQDNWYFNSDVEINAFLQNPNLDPVATNIVLLPTLSSDTIIIKGDKGKDDSRFSIFGRFSYNYKEKYLFTGTLRRDGSSRFGKNYRYGIFPAVSGGWVISEENMMDNASWLEFLKIRASWGRNGKEPNRPYRYSATVGSFNRSYPFGDGVLAGISPDIMPNANLKWEASEQLDIGFDSRFLTNFGFAFDWYREKSNDWIIPKTVPTIVGSSGISTENPYVNSGNVVNMGVEFDLSYTNRFGELGLDLNANFAYNKNTVTEVPGDEKIIHGSSSVLFNGSSEFYRVQEDFPIGYFWGYKTDGLFQSQDEVDSHVNVEGDLLQRSAEPGDVRRVDVNEDGVINAEDKTMIGDPNPDFIFGFTVGAEYKGFDFSMNLQGQLGNQIVKCYRNVERPFYNYTSDILDRWQWTDNNSNGIVDPGESNNSTVPRATGSAERNSNWGQISDLYVEDAGFLKIKSVNLGYNFKAAWKNAPVKQFRVYVAATNLFTFTKYTGLDPEVGYGSYYDSNELLTDAYATGVDLGFYPSARSYIVGVNVTF